MRILQEANSALLCAAAPAAADVDTDRAAAENEPAAAAQLQSLARAIQGAMFSLQDLPVLKDRNRDPAVRPGPPDALASLHHDPGCLLFLLGALHNRAKCGQ